MGWTAHDEFIAAIAIDAIFHHFPDDYDWLRTEGFEGSDTEIDTQIIDKGARLERLYPAEFERVKRDRKIHWEQHSEPK